MFCPNCGTENPAQGKFCKNCGHPLSQEQNAQPVQPEQKKSRKHGILIAVLSGVILLILVAAVIIGAFLLGKHDDLDGVNPEQNESAMIEEITQIPNETTQMTTENRTSITNGTTTAMTTTEATTTTTTEPKPDSMTIYAPVLDLFYNNIPTGWQGYGTAPYAGTAGFVNDTNYENVACGWFESMFFEPVTDLKDAGYQFIDINGDGTDELVVGLMSDIDGFSGYSGIDFYTYYHGQIIHLCSSYYRISCDVTVEGAFQIGSSGGMLSSSSTYYHLEHGKLLPFEAYLIEGYTNGDSPYFYADTFIQNASGGDYEPINKRNITEEEYREQGGHDIRDFDFTPFSQYKPN